MKHALITGVAGQDGAYLAELLLTKGYTVTGIARHASERNIWRLDALRLVERFPDRFFVRWGDLLDPGFLARCIDRASPQFDEVYNLAAQSDVMASFDTPDYTLQVNALGTARLLEVLRIARSEARFYQASTSELFGDSPSPQDENTPFRPMSPYAAAKCAAFWMVRTYRDAYGMHASNGILFNHESPLRAECFVTRKIAMAAARIAKGDVRPLILGNLEACRDWGHAKDYVRGMWQMLQQNKPADYVLATGRSFSVRQFVTEAFGAAEIPIAWTGDIATLISTNRVVVKTDPLLRRPLDVPKLWGSNRKAYETFGWSGTVSFSELVREMVDAERAKLRA